MNIGFHHNLSGGNSHQEGLMSKLFHLCSIFALLAALLGGAVTYTPAHAAGTFYAKPDVTNTVGFKSWATACTLPADRKSTRLNSSHANIPDAVFSLKK